MTAPATVPAPPSAVALIRAGEPEAGAWRFRLTEDEWRDLALALRHDPLPFVGLWADGQDVHALFLEAGEWPLVASIAPSQGRYLALSPVRPAAALPERCVQDLWGFAAMEARDTGPWLDHGLWTATWPLSARPGPVSWPPEPPDFAATRVPSGRTVLGAGPADGAHHAPAHLRLALGSGPASSGRIGAAEWRLGYAHRGVAARMRGLDGPAACRLAGRVAAGASVAHQSAFCRALEVATRTEIGPDTHDGRVMLAELERIATALHDVARTVRAAGGAAPAAECERLRETLLDLYGRLFGHRLLMDLVHPQGIGPEDAATLAAVARRAAEQVESGLPAIRRALSWPGLAARMQGRGVMTEQAARALGIGGPAGRASGREDDLRRLAHLVPGYRRDWLDSGVRRAGDVAARVDLRLAEIAGSARILHAAARDFSPGAQPPGTPQRHDGEGVGCAEGPRGAVWYWLRVAGGTILHAAIRDPALAQVAALDHVLPGADPDDAAMIVRSFGLSAAGADQ
ncbi:Ni Fe-hydrogenase III large subunit-like protein [Nguyenibacter sp. L1]|uniref:NADH-quinone oxidoreductase subunit D-related protein n=1 Tax=Nguyenibacter sp. L1 TaxID=3049350 RepID=UPI002B49081F|nr:Ni Fe-hydrogenase III large subunit-like protein [Nguyenibacter sp. L1]WRH87587.1 Ni Fe-hydrogenase III large subunit-like protein [Nguyenibacter sp. L1]